NVVQAAKDISYRAMILVYLELEDDQFTEFDAHYFPESDLLLTRLSETKNYAVRSEPKGRTVICAEVPCMVDDETWNSSDEVLGKRIEEDLKRCELTVTCNIADVWTRRLPQAYPLYPIGYEEPFETLDSWVATLPNFLSYGRQGLFAHDNTHHALFMAYSAANCLKDGVFDLEEWAKYREIFSHHVVED
ncbi:MAG: protoporphyrinogen oxidase, partial [Planctomycetota bacterium]